MCLVSSAHDHCATCVRMQAEIIQPPDVPEPEEDGALQVEGTELPHAVRAFSQQVGQLVRAYHKVAVGPVKNDVAVAFLSDGVRCENDLFALPDSVLCVTSMATCLFGSFRVGVRNIYGVCGSVRSSARRAPRVSAQGPQNPIQRQCSAEGISSGRRQLPRPREGSAGKAVGAICG